MLERLAATGRPRGDFVYAHIASPEVLYVPEEHEFRLYYHGMLADGSQATRVATSVDGLHFKALAEIIAAPYLRVFRWDSRFYGMAMPGIFYRSTDGVTAFETGPRLFNPDMRHAALLVRDDTLHVFWTQVGDAPERIWHSTIALTGNWQDWEVHGKTEIIRPTHAWEGASIPLKASVRGAISEPENALRDPALFEESGSLYLLYSVQGEMGIAVATIEL